MKITLSALTALFTLAFLSTAISAANVTRGYSEGYSSSLRIHYGVFKSETQPTRGDVLYFHGYGDTFENHLRLFKSMTDAGLRVIAFDLPSHGRTLGGQWDDLDWFSFRDLADVAGVIDHETLEDSSRPLILAGWSTGGLLAIRIAQLESLSPLSRLPKGLLLFAPAVSVPMCVGEGLCQITNETLTHDLSRYGREISPTSPLFRVKFAANLLYEASESWNPLPPNIPVLTWVADNVEDRYVNTPQLKSWVARQRLLRRGPVFAAQCVGSRHELDNESDKFGGQFVRITSAEFLRRVLSREAVHSSSLVSPTCSGF